MSFEFEVSFLESALPEIESYLFSDELFWPVLGNPRGRDAYFPRLTIGTLLLSIKRASALASSAATEAQVIQLKTRLNAYRTQWRANWEAKAHREIISRLNQWRNYLMEYRQNSHHQADFYPQEVRWRVIAALLSDEIKQLTDTEADMLNGLDNIVRGILEPGEFIWPNELQAAFPPSPFWYLYGKPRG
ncbi:MAG: hypothetical protein ACK2UW_08020 [Anaerolineales bacterium]|jgi:hypothetical protein